MYLTNPYQRNQVPYNPHYYPRFESNPHHHMNIDPTRSTLPYESWPCGGSSYRHPYPPECHSCCIHNTSPSQCAFSPPYPYLPPSTYNNCSYPTYPVMYPTHYVPHPHFTMEQPRYEYEKNMGRDHHCCGCSNHQCGSKKGGSSVKIEEHDQDKRNDCNDSLVPFGFNNCPYPVVCLPPDDMKNRERMKPDGSNCKEQEENPQVLKPLGDFRPSQQPNFWNLWPSHYGNSSGSPKENGDFPEKQHHDDAIRKQFPFPIIWMPYRPEEDREEVGKETESGLIAEKEPTSSQLRPKEYPDFMDKPDKTSYISERVIGKLFRKVKDKAPQASSIATFTREVARRSYDADMEVDGFEDYIDEAFDYKTEYDNKLGNLMDYYGIKTEAEILSGGIMKASKTFDRRKDAEAISVAVRALRKEARAWFKRRNDIDDMLPKASAWYHVTYHPTYWGCYNQGLKRAHFISFPWCVYDQLIQIKKDKARNRPVLNLSSLRAQLSHRLVLK